MKIAMSHYLLWLLVITLTTSGAFSSPFVTEDSSRVSSDDLIIKDILMPNVTPTRNDDYFCAVQSLNTERAYIVQMEAKAEARKAHHILLFGCKSVSREKLKQRYWRCSENGLCDGMKILFAWAKNAPPTLLPKDVGFKVGNDADINHLILQVHYALPLSDADDSGLRLHITYKPQKYVAGILLLVGVQTVIPPFQEKIHSDINCVFKSNVPIHPFAYRVHAHQLGVVITGYKFNTKDDSWTLLGKGNPQWPQAFYPMKDVVTVQDSDILVARCTFNSSKRNRTTYIGSTANDEMCNFYIMYYTTNNVAIPENCIDMQYPELVKLLPSDSDVPLPPNPLLEHHALGLEFSTATSSDNSLNSLKTPVGNGATTNWILNKGKLQSSDENGDLYDVSRGRVHHTDTSPLPEGLPISEDPKQGKFLDLFGSFFDQDENLYSDVFSWPKLKMQLGQVSGVTLNSKGNVVIFHRGPVVWGHGTFNNRHEYLGNREEPIRVDTVLTLDQNSGELLSAWGKDLFFMPHGIAMDANDNIWITDVALHQVIKYPADGGVTPLLSLGKRFEPGKDNSHYCKPSSVAISTNGEFFVADGYCNNRILKYSFKGELLLQWGQKTTSLLGIKIGTPPAYAFDVPHRLALAEDKGLILVADRENGRIQCFYTSNGTFHSKIQASEFGGRLFSVAYSPVNGGIVFAVNGPAISSWRRGIKGFVIQLSTLKIIGYFTPSETAFSNPHDVIATSDGKVVYVAEIGPNRIWKFEKSKDYASGKQLLNDQLIYEEPAPYINSSISVTSTSTILKLADSLLALDNSKAVKEKYTQHSSFLGVTNLTASMIIMALLAIPILIVIFVAVFVRLKKQGKFHGFNLGHVKGWLTGYKNPNSDRFGIGNILHPHKGFDRVNVEDSDMDSHSSESDVEEYSAKVLKA